MFFFNLSLPEFLALLGSVSGVVVALYLLDRARRKQTVATLRFFTAASSPPERAHRRHVQQPLSMLLQLLGMALLLLALAQLRCGSPEKSARDHVLILDTSAWMNASDGAGGRLIDRARATARAYLRALSPVDRVMLVRADALATPVTSFTANREALDQAIDGSRPGASVLNIEQTIHFASEAQRIQAGPNGAGEIAFIGAGRIEPEVEAATLPANLRVIFIGSPAHAENCGLGKVTVRRSADHPDEWEIFVSVKNYSPTAKSVSLLTVFDGAASGSRALVLKADSEENATFMQRTQSAGMLDVRLSPRDMFPQDNRAVLELPAPVTLPVTVYSDQPDSLKALLQTIPGVRVTFEPVARYDRTKSNRIVVLDRFAPAEPPGVDAIWIEPPASHSPVPFASEVDHVKLVGWRSDHPLGAGLHTKDLELDHAILFRTSPEDIRVAEAEAGPLIVARNGKTKTVVMGFEPTRSSMKYQLATPLLFANILRWMAPETFRRVELSAGAAGTVTATLDSEIAPASIKVTGENGRALPFTVDGKSLRFFTAVPGVARVLAGNQELVYSLTLPAPGPAVWNPGNVRKGLPPRSSPEPHARDLWPALALLGAAALLADWFLFGTGWRKRRATARQVTRKFQFRKAS